MSLTGFEFISPEDITVKCEINKEDDQFSQHNFKIQQDNYKCGEIFTSNCYDFYLICVDCGAGYVNTSEFGEHLRTNHQRLADADIFASPVKSEPPPEVECIGNNKKNPSKIKETKGKNLGKNKRLPEYACEFCGKQYRYRQSFERHVCQNVWKEDEPPSMDSPDNLSIASSDVDQPLKLSPLESSILAKSTIDLVNQSGIKSPTTANTESNQSEQIDAKEENLCINRNDEVLNKTETGKRYLFCEICQQQFKHTSNFRKHGMKHEEAPLELKQDPMYRKCLYCNKTFTNNYRWFRHEMSHAKKITKKKPVTCEQCGANFGSSKNFEKHLQRVHLKLKRHSCKICQKAFYSNPELQEHIRRHTGEKIFQCEKCGRKFMTSKTLKEHKKSKHTNLRDVKCSLCPATFFTNNMLKNHLVAHSTERPHVCSTCGNAFRRPKNLTEHKKIHMEIKKYVCSLCGKTFAQQAGLYMHKKTHLKDGEI